VLNAEIDDVISVITYAAVYRKMIEKDLERAYINEYGQ
jgi:hypothetical protein